VLISCQIDVAPTYKCPGADHVCRLYSAPVLFASNAMADLYNLSSHYWAGNVISLHAATASGHVFATVPLNFVVGNGVNTWEYILDLAEMLVEPVTDCPGSIETVDGDAVHLAAEPCAGDYVFTHRGK